MFFKSSCFDLLEERTGYYITCWKKLPNNPVIFQWTLTVNQLWCHLPPSSSFSSDFPFWSSSATPTPPPSTRDIWPEGWITIHSSFPLWKETKFAIGDMWHTNYKERYVAYKLQTTKSNMGWKPQLSKCENFKEFQKFLKLFVTKSNCHKIPKHQMGRYFSM